MIVLSADDNLKNSEEGEKIKILACDDSKLVRLKFRRILEEVELGDYIVEFLEAEDGEEGIELYKEHKPDLLFLDIVMPEKSGVEVVTDVIEFDSEAKIVMVSSVGTKENLEQALNNGATDFVQKPLTKNKIENLLPKLI
ncbi:MAG: response regulator [Bacillota bacterium]